jgi:ABC-type sugar transport system ATPase subunit
MTLIFVSHRVEEIFEISDRIVVFRDGEKVKDTKTKDTSEKELISSMVGRDIGDLYTIRNRNDPGETVLEVSHIKWRNRVLDCSFSVRKGEVLGIYGLVGAGRTELIRVLFGAEHPEGGKVLIKKKTGFIKSPLHAVKMKIGMVPEDRKSHGILINLPIYKNMTLSYLAREPTFWIHKYKEESLVKSKINELSIKTMSLGLPVSSLSGGNQQKVVIAKWLLTEPELLFLDEPTRGIDIGAKFEIYRLIDRLASLGVAIVLVSSELPEILALSDRILIMKNGRFIKELAYSEASEERVLSYST